MNVYFSCSITGGRNEEKTYQAIVNAMLSWGHIVPTAHLSRPEVTELENVVEPIEIFQRDITWLMECDAVVAEVSSPSHGVGYEIAYALNLGKPVLCCYQEGKRVSKIITGNMNPTITIKTYVSDEDAIEVVRDFLLAQPSHF